MISTGDSKSSSFLFWFVSLKGDARIQNRRNVQLLFFEYTDAFLYSLCTESAFLGDVRECGLISI